MRFILAQFWKIQSTVVGVLLWGLCQSSISWWEHVAEEAAYSMVAQKQRETGRDQDSNILFEGTPLMT